MSFIDYRSIISSTDESSSNYYASIFVPWRNTSEPNDYITVKEAGTTNAVKSNNISMLNVPYLAIARSNGSAWTIRINGVDKILTAIAGANNGWWFNDVTTRDNIIVGGSILGSTDYPAPKIKISEVLIYNRNITGSELTIIENYINRRYSIWSSFYDPYLSLKANHYKVQLHTHTTNSDGAQSPTSLMTSYKNAGYTAVAITDHDTITADPVVAGITHIPGCEETVTGGHIPCLFLTARETSATDQTVINTILGQGGFVDFAHPNYTGAPWTTGELNALYSAFFLEVYNRVVENLEGANGYAEVQWDWLLTNRVFPYNRFFGIAVDDCHDVTATPSQFNNGWIVVHANSVAEIEDSILNGNFYSTQGPDLTITYSGGVVTAVTTDAATIAFIVDSGVVAQSSASSTTASYTPAGADTYVRVKVTRDSDSKIAWSNPIFIP
ncbi:MAG: hypothetical protein A2Z71_11730 [Chloroflexi bacterium RBG_13_50_21]|nr:MAG: hypothetical protein A2Z71_11730 [Chloroflexi bacterium RBG_13_50_21]